MPDVVGLSDEFYSTFIHLGPIRNTLSQTRRGATFSYRLQHSSRRESSRFLLFREIHLPRPLVLLIAELTVVIRHIKERYILEDSQTHPRLPPCSITRLTNHSHTLFLLARHVIAICGNCCICNAHRGVPHRAVVEVGKCVRALPSSLQIKIEKASSSTRNMGTDAFKPAYYLSCGGSSERLGFSREMFCQSSALSKQPQFEEVLQ
ncbi:hypothetical protein L218DRAFT_967478 [Marasmius fiardii PR-910]|nr:hypothetical protein L218DRAFT_967478 [Marasmius fiardii PR-910]